MTDKQIIGAPVVWNENLLIRDSFENFLKPTTLLLFELLDFGPKLSGDNVSKHFIGWLVESKVASVGKGSVSRKR